jgi:hypothetical protein
MVRIMFDGYSTNSGLETAVAEDAQQTAKGKFGPRVSCWFGQMVKKAAEGTWKAGIAIAGMFLPEAITKYYGLS